MNSYDVVVAGAGPSGLMAALAAADAGARVLICESQGACGKKLMASGGGRCNITNLLPLPQFINRFKSQSVFVKPSLKEFPPEKLMLFFESQKCSLTSTDSLHVYPTTNRATDVVKMLLAQCAAKEITIINDTHCDRLIIENGKLSGVQSSQGHFPCRAAVIATGGKSYPGFGADGSGYALASRAGHSVVKPLPALTDIRCLDSWVRDCKGITLENVSLTVDNPPGKAHQFEGSMLFTHQGISGPAALDASSLISRALQSAEVVGVKVCLFPGLRGLHWVDMFTKWQQTQGSRTVAALLAAYMPQRIAGSLCRLAGIGETLNAAGLTRRSRTILIEFLSDGVRLQAHGTGDFSTAMVTCGGVSRKEVHPRTLASRAVEGLYFCGEVLDVDGPCGGFNLQWAFSSGYVAGKSAATLLKS